MGFAGAKRLGRFAQCLWLFEQSKPASLCVRSAFPNAKGEPEMLMPPLIDRWRGEQVGARPECLTFDRHLGVVGQWVLLGVPVVERDRSI